jgi:hypothetical protein
MVHGELPVPSSADHLPPLPSYMLNASLGPTNVRTNRQSRLADTNTKIANERSLGCCVTSGAIPSAHITKIKHEIESTHFLKPNAELKPRPRRSAAEAWTSA